jgi:hypothetical protein
MAEGKQRDRWDHTSTLLAQLENCAFGSKGGTHPRDRNPFAKIDARRFRRRRVAENDWDAMRLVFVERQVGKGIRRDERN